MLKKFVVRNFKNFREELSIDFSDVNDYSFSEDCLSDGLISKMLIYGRNATGKTNLGSAITNIKHVIADSKFDDDVIVNTDSGEDSAFFSYTFLFDEEELIYQYWFRSDYDLVREEFYKDGEKIFLCDFIKKEFDFEHLDKIGAETANKDRYLSSLRMDDEGKNIEFGMPFLRWLINNVAFEQNSSILKFDEYVKRMMTIHSIKSSVLAERKVDKYFKTEKRLQGLEQFLGMMGIDCRLALERLPDGKQELYFSGKKSIPFFQNASSGTLSLVQLYIGLEYFKDASFLYLDEFDAFYHYEMAFDVIRYLKNRYPKCQVIFTSHNTNLMTNRLLRPDCFFILSGTGQLTALRNATSRELREGHNLEKMYISGEFDAYE